MSSCDLTIRLEEPPRPRRPGETIRGEVGVRVNDSCQCNGLKLVMQWRAHGRGNRAEGPENSRELFMGSWGPGQEHRYPFEFVVPNGPATYHGKLLNVDWVLRARADVPWAIDPKAEAEFLLEPAASEAPYDHGSAYSPPAELYQASTRASGVAAVVFGGVGAVGVAVGLGLAASGQTVAGLAAGGAFLLIGAIGMAAVMWRKIAQQKLGTPQVRIGRSVVHPGEPVTVKVTLAPPADLQIGGVGAELRGFEEVISGSGTNQTTHTEKFHSSRLELSAARTLGAGAPLELEGVLNVPAGAAPTFSAPCNKLAWVIALRVEIPGWPDWTQDYPISVAP